MKRIVPTAIAITFGIVVLLDFFISHPLLDRIGAILADWAVILAAFALILGILNVLSVHLNRTVRREKGWPYGLVLVIALLAVLILGLMPGAGGPPSGGSSKTFTLPSKPPSSHCWLSTSCPPPIGSFEPEASRPASCWWQE